MGIKKPNCKCKCCQKNVFENISTHRKLLKSIQALSKIEQTPQMGLAYTIAKDALEDMRKIDRL